MVKCGNTCPSQPGTNARALQPQEPPPWPGRAARRPLPAVGSQVTEAYSRRAADFPVVHQDYLLDPVCSLFARSLINMSKPFTFDVFVFDGHVFSNLGSDK